MKDGIIDNVKTTIKSIITNEKTMMEIFNEKEMMEIFNEKLLKIILSLEKDNTNIRCQM